LQMKEGDYMSMLIRMGSFEHTLTTDLLNQIIFLQEVFMSEVNDVIKKLSKDPKASSIWSESSLRSVDSSQSKPMLYQLELQLDGIQITATTPSSNAVRLKTGKMVFELSNRVIRAEAGRKIKSLHKYLKLFGKAQVDLTLSLGTLLVNDVYMEAESEFQQLAYFTTRIGLQNTSQQAQEGDQIEDNNIILISLTRPIFFVQPTAFDKAILLYLAYKNAYDDWNEKREDLHEEVKHATKEVVGAIHASRMMNDPTNPVAVSNLFLQLSVHDLGICLPTRTFPYYLFQLSTQEELPSALVLTVDNTLISVCYAKSLVTRGNFKGFCLRFTDDFQTSWDDSNLGFMGSKSNVIMNSFLVPAGTYEICTDTTSYQIHTDLGVVPTARTSVNIMWQMDGVDLEIDTKIGAYLTHLVDTLTVITGNDESLRRDSSESDSLNELDGAGLEDTVDGGPGKSPDSTSPKELTQREKTKKLEMELNEPVVNDLKSLGAKPALIDEQVRKLHTLEVALSSIFRQTFRNKLRRSSTKQASVSFLNNLFLNLPPPKSAQSAFSTLPPSVRHTVLGEASPPLWSFSPTHTSEQFKDVFSPVHMSAKKEESMSDNSSADYEISEDDDDRRISGARRSLYLDDTVDGAQDTRSLGYPQNVSHVKVNTKYNCNLQMTTTGMEAELELILDIRVEIQGGQIVCHPTKPSDPSRWRILILFPDSSEIKRRNNASQQDDILHTRSGGEGALQLGEPRTDQANSRFPSGKYFYQQKNTKLLIFLYFYLSLLLSFLEHFNSQNAAPGSKVPNIQISNATPTPHMGKVNLGLKRACVYAWFSIQSLPEMIISPCFLDFLEQTLDALPATPNLHGSRNPSQKTTVEVFNETMASLPVDVVVYVHVQPSQVCFNCQPMSRVECLLHVPSLDLVFSSIRDSSMSTSPSTDRAFTYPVFPNGLSFTAIMSDFSVFVFHPYGTQQSMGVDPSHNPNVARKDSLSINLEVVKMNIVRTRRGTPSLNLETSQSFNIKINEPQKVVINLSALLDIGKASFKYDMRRLSEILAFPRAWYRKSIARRIFFGEASSAQRCFFYSYSLPPQEAVKKTGSFLNQDSLMTPKRRTASHISASTSDKATGLLSFQHEENEGDKIWEGVVLFGLSMSRLDVEMNMSNVMGHTVWSCDELKSNGRLNLHSTGDKNVFLSCGLKNSQLSAKGGIIGGQIELQELHANCHLLEPEGKDPLHKILVKMRSLDGRIEYMGGCVMMGRLTSVNLKLSDEWKGPKLSIPTSIEKSAVFVPGNLGWDSFCLTITGSTTPDVIKMLSKLEEFFTQQFQNSVRAFSSWRHSGHLGAPVRRPFSVTTAQATYSHRRHWPPVYIAISDTFRALGVATNPQFLLGGSMCLHGNELRVVCFHGSNFRSKSWVLFNILEPNIVFSTEVQQIKESVRGHETSTLAIQSLTFNLGHDHWLKTGGPSTDPMATVSRVTSAAPLDEWFAYVTASHNQGIAAVRTWQLVLKNRKYLTGLSPSDKSRKSSSSQASYNHETDIIFALPKLQLDFKSEHMQGPNEPAPSESENKPTVECSFVTEFTDHICVTMDVELIMFLHDLISSYLKVSNICPVYFVFLKINRTICIGLFENNNYQSFQLNLLFKISSTQKVQNYYQLNCKEIDPKYPIRKKPAISPTNKCTSQEKQQALSSRTRLTSVGAQPSDLVTTIDPIDLREFVCNTWQLEPTVRLISWAGRRIEPVGVDYILQKLGFSHARTTIPKWFQRGVLDLLDQIIAVMVQNLVVTV
uniref:Bridge-like lipid transfer protein family member 1 C-terminal domain-containing protein n=1 Tax=Ciona savignyi TaxID=51511 RepID=H2YW78_CIOSA